MGCRATDRSGGMAIAILSQVIESSLEKSIGRWCKQQGYQWLKLAGPKGWPDRTLIMPGRVVFVETKTLTGRLSPHQKFWMAKLTELGQECFVVRSLEDLKSVLQTN